MFKTPKRHILARNWVFCVKVSEGPRLWARGRTQKNEHFRSYISPIWGEKTSGQIGTKFCTGEISRRNHQCKFGGRSVKPFLCGERSNFRLFHRLLQSSLQHSRTTVRVCDSPGVTSFSCCCVRPLIEL